MVRLFLLHGASPLDRIEGNALNSLDRAKARAEAVGQKTRSERAKTAKAVAQELELYLENPPRYCSDRSPLIALSIGLASLDLPVLLLTIVAEYLVWINQDELVGQYSQQKSWDIAALIKKKAKKN